MLCRSLFTLILCFVILTNVDEILARKRSEPFRRGVKQLKYSIKICLAKLMALQERSHPGTVRRQTYYGYTTNLTALTNNTRVMEITLGNGTSAEERYNIIHDLQYAMAERVNRMPDGKLKIELLQKYKNALARASKFIPATTNDTNNSAEEAVKLRDTILAELNEQLEQLKFQERMYRPKQRRKILEAQAQENLFAEMDRIQKLMSTEMENRSQLAFPENVPYQIWVQRENLTTLKPDLTASVNKLIDSREVLEDIKILCDASKAIYNVQVSAIVDLATYLLQNVELQIELMMDVSKLLNRQPSLIAGTFKFQYTRSILDTELVRKASTEVYELTRTYAEERNLTSKIKDEDWSRLANKTRVMFFRLNGELAKQNQQFLIAV